MEVESEGNQQARV